MASPGNKHIFQGWLAERNCLDLAWKRFHQPRDPLVSLRDLQSHISFHHAGGVAKAALDAAGQILRRTSLDRDRIAADRRAQRFGRIERNELTVVENRDTVRLV